VQALRDVPELNGSVAADGTPKPAAEVHLALAVATGRGVVAPVLRRASDLSVEGVARERARLVEAARTHAVDPRDLAGATCTLSNLGGLPVDFFTPVITAPQIALIAIGRVQEQPVVRDGMLGVGHRMWVNAAIDHRGADGEAGGRFLQALERRLDALEAAL
jgi:pyruvate dehydrogenase E2 component (dihydrolipoamide acetyltransferase)